MEQSRRSAYRTGWLVFLALVVLTAIEFYVATLSGMLVALFVIALVKAALIVWYFMHVYRLWSEDEHS